MKVTPKYNADKVKSIRFYKYFFSYVLITIILLIILGSAVNSNLIASIQKRVEAENTSSLSQIKDMMDLRLKEMERITFQISTNFRLSPSTIGTDGYDSLQANKELKNYSAANAFVYDIGLYYMNRGNETLYASTGIYTLDYFFNTEYMFEAFNKQSFLSTISGLKTPLMLPVKNVKLYNLTQSAFALYLYPMPLNTDKPYGVVAYFIELKALRGIINQINTQDRGYIYMLDDRNTPIVSLEAVGPEYEQQEILDLIDIESVNQGVTTLKVKNEFYSIVKLISDYNQWSYVAVMPTEMFMQSVDDSKRLFLLIVLAVLILGILMAYFFAKHNYRSWGKLVSLIQGQDSANQIHIGGKTDEVAYITEAVSKVTNENRNLMTQLRSRSGMMREQVLFSLLNGKIESLESTDNLAEISGLRFNQPYFAVLLFLIDDYQRFSKANSKAMQDLFKFAVINITEELAAEFGSGYGIDLLNERGIAIILNLSKDNETDLLMDLGMRSKDFFSQNFRFTLTVGIGSLYEDSGMIKQSFAEASRAAYYRMILGGDRVIFYTELSGIDSRVKYNYPTELEMGLILAIKHGRMNEMEQIVNTIMESMVSQEIAPENVQFICSGIINAILKTIKDIGLEFHSEQDKELVELFTQDFETIAIFEARIIEISRKVGRYIQNSRESKNFILRDRILKYVTEHYTDSNLSLNSIAEQFEVTPSYLTRYFKDQTGYPLMQYLDSVRMGKAKELLKSSDLKSKEIMIRSGYVDENNFIRKFKKGEGLTPIQYRNLTKNGKKEED